jgi:hypothetical protein
MIGCIFFFVQLSLCIFVVRLITLFARARIPGRLNLAHSKLLPETCRDLAHGVECIKPRMCIAGKAGTKIKLRLEFLEGRLYLPIIRIERI